MGTLYVLLRLTGALGSWQWDGGGNSFCCSILQKSRYSLLNFLIFEMSLNQSTIWIIGFWSLWFIKLKLNYSTELIHPYFYFYTCSYIIDIVFVIAIIHLLCIEVVKSIHKIIFHQFYLDLSKLLIYAFY